MSRQLSPFWTLFILTGLNLFNYLDRFVLPAVLKPLRAELHLDGAQSGTIATAFMVGYFITSPCFGLLGDRMTRKWLIAGGILVWSIGTVLTGFARSYEQLLLYRVLVGVGEASYATISPGLISDSFPEARRNNALTIFYVATPVGAALGNVIGGTIAAHYTWCAAFVWAGLPGLLLALVLLPFREGQRGQADGVSASSMTKPQAADLLRLFRLPQYMLVVLGYTAYTFALGGFGHWGPIFLSEVHRVPVDDAGQFFGVVLAAAGLVGTLVGGFAATAWQKRQPTGYALTLGLSVLAAIPLALLALLARERIASMAGLALAMFLLFLPTGPVNTLILGTVPLNLRSSAMAISIFLIHLLGDMWSPKIVGHLWDHWGNLSKATLILPVALVVAAALWLALAWKQKQAPKR